ncbi:hypothetical protein R1sor_012896 [Riccia sorocarpa]|uniref:Uncharacterized protein n=1 Tax=Riccia sorocarpa TaxID=122646 RepID=A0ABD3I535_9MARC
MDLHPIAVTIMDYLLLLLTLVCLVLICFAPVIWSIYFAAFSVNRHDHQGRQNDGVTEYLQRQFGNGVRKISLESSNATAEETVTFHTPTLLLGPATTQDEMLWLRRLKSCVASCGKLQ